MREYVIAILLLAGSVFVLLAAVGIVRMPDIFARMHATTKAATLGVSLMVLAVSIALPERGDIALSAAIVFFLFLTAPISAHMIGSAAYFSGVSLWEGTTIDELKGK